jgi:hypothetical protein
MDRRLRRRRSLSLQDFVVEPHHYNVIYRNACSAGVTARDKDAVSAGKARADVPAIVQEFCHHHHTGAINQPTVLEVRFRLKFCQQRIHLEPDACEQRGLAQERYQKLLRFRHFGVELQLYSRHHAQPVYGGRDRLCYSPNGKITRNGGTNWQNIDGKGIWRPDGYGGRQEISFGIHGDRYYFTNPVYGSSVWNDASTVTGQTYSDGIGEH